MVRIEIKNINLHINKKIFNNFFALDLGKYC